jgi:hypothetical protein
MIDIKHGRLLTDTSWIGRLRAVHLTSVHGYSYSETNIFDTVGDHWKYYYSWQSFAGVHTVPYNYSVIADINVLQLHGFNVLCICYLQLDVNALLQLHNLLS